MLGEELELNVWGKPGVSYFLFFLSFYNNPLTIGDRHKNFKDLHANPSMWQLMSSCIRMHNFCYICPQAKCHNRRTTWEIYCWYWPLRSGCKAQEQQTHSTWTKSIHTSTACTRHKQPPNPTLHKPANQLPVMYGSMYYSYPLVGDVLWTLYSAWIGLVNIYWSNIKIIEYYQPYARCLKYMTRNL